jgi:broad specificity phosphatase PhoE
MDILLVRHLASAKNVENRFSSVADNEPLTEDGRLVSTGLAVELAQFVRIRGGRARSVYCASSERAQATAHAIASFLNIPVEAYTDLCSIRTALAGHTEAYVAQEDPEFMHQLQLYRLGLLSSYSIRRQPNDEQLLDFEHRIAQRVESIIQVPEEPIKILVLHRSPITATLIRFAREYYRYPQDFFGFVPLDTGNISWICHHEGMCTIRAVNVNSKELVSLASKL